MNTTLVRLQPLQDDDKRVLLDKFNNIEVVYLKFMHDGATCHTADATMDILHGRFMGMVITQI